MKEKFKEKWLAILSIVVLVTLCAGSVYYVNGVYLPAKKAQRIEALKQTVQGAAPELEESSYKYAVEASEPEKSAYNYTIEVPEATDGNKLTQGSDAAITADVETVETADETAAPVKNVPTGNMASGTVENIAGDDGIYHGEQPPTPEPEPEPEPSSTPEPKPSPTPSGTSSSGSTPKDGDRKTIDGVEYEYDGIFKDWYPVLPGYSEPSKGTHGTSGETEPNASF